MRKNEIDKFFKIILTSAALRIRKPRPEIFIKALDALNARPGDAAFIGDSLDADVIGARNVGIHAIYLRRKPPEHDALVVPEATASNLTEAVGIIKSWASA
jgi:putative hydrolase of the HAD superfamily